MGRSKLRTRHDELAASYPILSTIHGSRLYGLAHKNSDHDVYNVVLGCKKNFAWGLNEDDDAVHIHLSRFWREVEAGTPQALEALYSPAAETAPEWRPFFTGMRPGIDNTRATYRRTITNFGVNLGGRTGAAASRVNPVKLRRHALRLALNLNDLVNHGRFNPVLSDAAVAAIKELAGDQVLPDQRFEERRTTITERALLGTLSLTDFTTDHTA